MPGPNPTGTFPLTVDAPTLNDPFLGFAIGNEAQAVSSMARFSQLVQTGMLSGQTLAQALNQVLGFFDANADVIAAPVAVYSGAAGAVTRYYAAVPRYALVPGPGLGTQGAIQFLPGAPPEGRTPNGGIGAGQTSLVAMQSKSGRSYRYGLMGARTTVANTAAVLTAANTVAITAPAAGAAQLVIGVATFDIVATDVNGIGLYPVALGVLAGAVVNDIGAPPSSQYRKPVHAEVAKGPTSASVLYAPPTSLAEGGAY